MAVIQSMSSLPGTILCVSGAMGAGKSTLVRVLTGNVEGLTDYNLVEFIIRHHRLLKDFLRNQFHLDLSDQVKVVPSYTTRAARGDEMKGEYIFTNRDDFIAMVDRGECAWWVEVHQCFYGTRWADLEASLSQPGFGVINVTPETVVYHISQSLFETGKFRAIFVDSPHRRDWMEKRGGLSPDVINAREEINETWDDMVTGANDRFFRLENSEEDNLIGLIHDLSGFLGQIPASL